MKTNKWMKMYRELEEATRWRSDTKKLEEQLIFRVEEMKQAKEYIKELENVVEKSKENILFLKDILMRKDDKLTRAMKDLKFYKDLSEKHISESSRLAKELISIRSNLNRFFTVKSMKNNEFKSFEQGRSKSASSNSIKQNNKLRVNTQEDEINLKPKLNIDFSTTLTSSVQSNFGCQTTKYSRANDQISTLKDYKSLLSNSSAISLIPQTTKHTELTDNEHLTEETSINPSLSKRRNHYKSLIARMNKK